jgi:hypothetical protein
VYFPKLTDLEITWVFSAEKPSQLLYVGRRNEQLCKGYPVLYRNCSCNMFVTTKDSYTCIKSSYYFYYTIISELKCHHKIIPFFLLSTDDTVVMKKHHILVSHLAYINTRNMTVKWDILWYKQERKLLIPYNS